MQTYELFSPVETLELKLGIWQRKLQYAKGAYVAECERAIADIARKLAAAKASA